MKSLVRAKIINWHFFENQTISFAGSTLITGENGSGKSTILDAIQFALIGDQRKIRFNESAHSQSKRDLMGYLRCKTGSEGSVYLRNGDFTSYVALEFLQTEKDTSFVAGVVIDVYASGEHEATYFIIGNCTIDDSLFLERSASGRPRPYGRKDFRERIRSVQDASFFASSEEYRRNLMARLGHVSDRFFSLITKGVAFQPITDVQRFVYDYVLDEKPLNVEIMLENFRHYKEYEELVRQTKEKIAALEPILRKHKEIASIERSIEVQDYLILRARLEQCEEDMRRTDDKNGNLTRQLDEIRTKLQDCAETLEQLRSRERELVQLMVSSEVYAKKRTLEQRRDFLRSRLSELAQNARRFSGKCLKSADDIGYMLRDREQAQVWGLTAHDVELLEAAAEVLTLHGKVGEQASTLATTMVASDGIRDDLAPLAERVSETEREISSARDGTLEGYLEQLRALAHEYLPEVQKSLSRLASRIAELKDEEDRVKRELDSLRQGRRVYPRNVQELIGALVRSGTEAKALCELLEIKNPRWRDAVEGYLNTQKFDLIVRPGEFDAALTVYEREKVKRNISGVGLVNTGKVLERTPVVEEGSLAEEVQSDNVYAQAYVARLLGRVIKCENELELKRYTLAITPTCMTYRNHTARQIPFEAYAVPFIGKDAVPLQVEMKQRRLEDIRKEMTKVQGKLDITREAERVLRYLEEINWADELIELGQKSFEIPVIARGLLDVLSELGSLDVSDLTAIQRRLDVLRLEIKQCDEANRFYAAESGKLEAEIEELTKQRNSLEYERGSLEGIRSPASTESWVR